MPVGIIGYGYVGRGVHKIFPDAWIYDVGGDRGKINESDLAIVCVPTPPIGSAEQKINDDQSEFLGADISIVEKVVSWIEAPLILIKSTIPPGTTEYLKKKYNKRVCFSPEYMGEGGYYMPPQYPDPTNPVQHNFMIIGGDDKDCDDIYDVFIEKMGPAKTYYKCSATEAEIIKHMENCWIATKVIFCNEFKNICDAFDASYNTVREGWLLDPRIERMHTAVFKNKPGFGGKCLPKDLHSIVANSNKQGYDANFLKSVWRSNQGFRNGREERK